MLDFSQMIINLVIALGLGAVMGIERGLVGKEVGIRTSMLVSGGAAMFTMIALSFSNVLGGGSPELATAIAVQGNIANIIASIITGIGFLGAGMIIKTDERVHGLTTAAVVWATAGIGIFVGLGMTRFALVAAVFMAGLLYLLRKIRIDERLHQMQGK